MSSINMDRMSPRSPEFLSTFDKAGGRRVLESHSRYQAQNAAIDDSRSYRNHRDYYSGSSSKRLRYSGADEAVDQLASHASHRSSREVDSLLIEASVSSRGARSHGSTKEPRKHHLPSPPPDEYQHYRRGQVEVFTGATRARRSRDLQGFGAWSDHIALPQQPQLLTESASNDEEISQSRRMSRSSIPDTPRDWLLPTPELSPMPTHYTFCPCCVDEDSRINDTWHMAGKEKMHTQMETAMAYIEQMKFNK